MGGGGGTREGGSGVKRGTGRGCPAGGGCEWE